MALKEREGCPLRLVCPKVSFGAFSGEFLSPKRNAFCCIKPD